MDEQSSHTAALNRLAAAIERITDPEGEFGRALIDALYARGRLDGLKANRLEEKKEARDQRARE